MHKAHYQNFEPPFEIPDSWEWCNLIDCGHIAGRIGFRGYTKEDLVSGADGAITLSPSNIMDGNMDFSKCTYISWKKYEESPEIKVENGDILLVKTGSSFGKCALVRNLPNKATINPQFVVLKHVNINPQYLTYVLQSKYARDLYDKYVLGTAIPTFTQEKLGNTSIPLPPFHEQNRIVKMINSILSFADSLDVELSLLSKRINSTKSKILELAMQGKLVPQDPADEPAADMLRRINPKAKILSDNPYYPQVPDKWTKVRLEDIVDYEQPQPYIVSDTDYSDSYYTPVLTAGKSFILGYTNEDFGVYDHLPVIIFDDFTTDTHLVDFPFKVKSSAMKILTVKPGINIEFVSYFMSITRLVGDTHKRYWISEYSKLEIPIPPLGEQERIVSKVRSVFTVLDNLSNSLS